MEIHSDESGLNHTLSIEGSTCKYHDKYCNYGINEENKKMKFHSYFSDDSAHNASTICKYMKKFINWMYNENLVINDGIIYNTTDGCSKQYICANSLWNLLVLLFTYTVVINRYINAPVHEIIKIYGINGS